MSINNFGFLFETEGEVTKTVTDEGDGVVTRVEVGEKELLEGDQGEGEPISAEEEELLLEGVSGLEMGDKRMEGIKSAESAVKGDKSVVVLVSSVSASVSMSLLSTVSSVSVPSALPVVASSGVGYAGVVSSKGVVSVPSVLSVTSGVVSSKDAGDQLEKWVSEVFVVERKFRQSSMVRECMVEERVCLSERVVDRVVERFGAGLIPSEVWGCMTYFEREKVKEKRIRGNLKRACQKEVVSDAKKSKVAQGAVYSSYLAEKVSRLKDLVGAVGDGVLMSEGVSLLK